MSAVAPSPLESSPPARALLGEGDVDLWLCATSVLTDSLRTAYRQILSGSELDRLQRFRVSSAADEYLLGRALVRTTLSRYAPAAPSTWEFETGPHGKPHISGPATNLPLTFNLSHTTGLVACAVALGDPLGVDVEYCGRDLDLPGFSAANFAAAEQAIIAKTPDADLRGTFFQIWTLKEAYIKGLGVGLGLPLDSFWFDLTSPPRLRLREGADDAWRFRHLTPTSDHRLSVALAAGRSAALRVQVHWTTPDPNGTPPPRRDAMAVAE